MPQHLIDLGHKLLGDAEVASLIQNRTTIVSTTLQGFPLPSPVKLRLRLLADHAIELEKMRGEMHQGAWEKFHLRRLASGVPRGEVIRMVDVGANVGLITIAAQLFHPAPHRCLQTVAVEPVPLTYFLLRWNLWENNITELSEDDLVRSPLRSPAPALGVWPAGRARCGVLPLRFAITSNRRPVEMRLGSRSMNALVAGSMFDHVRRSVGSSGGLRDLARAGGGPPAAAARRTPGKLTAYVGTGSSSSGGGSGGSRSTPLASASSQHEHRRAWTPSVMLRDLTSKFGRGGNETIHFMKIDCEGCAHVCVCVCACAVCMRMCMCMCLHDFCCAALPCGRVHTRDCRHVCVALCGCSH